MKKNTFILVTIFCFGFLCTYLRLYSLNLRGAWKIDQIYYDQIRVYDSYMIDSVRYIFENNILIISSLGMDSSIVMNWNFTEHDSIFRISNDTVIIDWWKVQYSDSIHLILTHEIDTNIAEYRFIKIP